MATTTIKLKVEDENIVFTSQPPVFSGDVNTITTEFEFGVNWDGLTKYAVFYRNIDDPYQVALESNNTCLIPHEVMETAGRMFIGVYGQADGKIKTSEVVFYDLGTGVLAGGQPSSETLNMWQQILQDMGEIREIGESIEGDIQTAQTAATTATQAASTATTKASEAATSASEASESASQAQTYAQAIEDMTEEISASINDALSPRIKESASGEAVQIDDASGARLAGLKLYGKGVQNIVKGKNLCSVADIEISGSQTVSLDEIPAGTYTISAVVTSTDTDANECLMMFYYTDSSTKEINIGRSTGTERKSVLVTFDKPVNKLRVYASTAHGTSAGDTASVSDLQIEAGSYVTPYEPYTDGKPSPENPVPIEVAGSDGSIDVSLIGKNIAKTATPRSQGGLTFSTKADGSFTVNGTANSLYNLALSGDLSLKRGKSYTLTGCPANGSNDTYRIDIRNKGITITNSLDFGEGATFKPSEDAPNAYINLRIESGTSMSGQLFKPMLVEGDTPGEYEPYTEQTLTISTPNGLPAVPVESGGNYTDEEGQQWVSDYIDFERGKYVQCVNVFSTKNVYNKPEYETETKWYLTLTIVDSSLNGKGKSSIKYVMTDNIKLVEQPEENNYDIPVMSTYGHADLLELRYKMPKAMYTTAEDAIDAVKDGIVLYPLAAPIETDLSAEQISAYKALHTNAGVTNIFTDSEPQAGIELDYIADTKMYIDKRIDAIATQVLDSIAGE